MLDENFLIIDKRYFEKFKKHAYDIVEHAGGIGWRYDHSLRVMQTSLKLAKHKYFANENIDLYSLAVGALFHDIDFILRVPEDKIFKFNVEDYPNHGVVGSEMIEEFLSELFQEDKKVNVGLVKKIIAGHCKRKEGKISNKTIEERIVADADNLEKIGIFMFYRSATYTGMKCFRIEDFISYTTSEMDLRIQSSLNRFFFEISKEIAEKRFKNLQSTIENFRTEITSSDII